MVKELISIEKKRHSAAHLLAMAVLEIFPLAKLGIGPAIESGFYYDFQLPRTLSVDDLPELEDKMKQLAKQNLNFERSELGAAEATKFFQDQPFKMEMIKDLDKEGNRKVSLYKTGGFTDLCRGGHVSSTSEININSFKLTKTAGAYWRGDANRPMLQRIYGVLFETKEELDAYRQQLEQAEKRDHKKLGKELDLFTFSDLVGAGLPLWTPKGTFIRRLLDDYVRQLRQAKGYEEVEIPHIAKKELYEVSGHWQKFADELLKIKTREGHELALKPMNCPHHIQIFTRQPHSYRQLPVRYADTTMVYRDEQSGELQGLTRVRAITQDDSHVFARKDQIKEEVMAIWDIVDQFYGTFNIPLSVRLSRHDPAQMEKYLGTPTIWQMAEEQLSVVIKDRGVEYVDGLDEAALYGPKIDFMGMDALGRLHQVATIQLDFNLPERFDLFCINEKGEQEQIVMIHCAIMGSIERFLSVLIEHYAGAFPTWLSPIQVSIIPVSDKFNLYAQDHVWQPLLKAGIRVKVNDDNESVGKKIRYAATQKIPYILVVGEKEVEAKTVAVRSRDKGEVGSMLIEKFSELLLQEVVDKSSIN